MTALVITAVAKGQGRFPARWYGEEICVSRQPFFDAARKLHELGYPDETEIACFADGNRFASFRSTVGQFRRLTVSEHDKGRISIKPYAPNPMFLPSPPFYGSPAAAKAGPLSPPISSGPALLSREDRP